MRKSTQLLIPHTKRVVFVRVFSLQHTVPLLVLLVCFLDSCSTLPHYGKPRFRKEISFEGVTTIPYRKLVRSDFKALQLPDDIKIWSDKFNAHTAVSIRPVRGSKFVVTSTKIKDKVVFVGASENLAFEAVMIPERSWWNPGIPQQRQSYVLQHEQIHFGLMEIAARRLNKFIADPVNAILVFEDSPNKASKKLREEVNLLIAGTREEILKEHTRFDEECSGYFVPEIQQKWADKVDNLLRSLSP